MTKLIRLRALQVHRDTGLVKVSVYRNIARPEHGEVKQRLVEMGEWTAHPHNPKKAVQQATHNMAAS